MVAKRIREEKLAFTFDVGSSINERLHRVRIAALASLLIRRLFARLHVAPRKKAIADCCAIKAQRFARVPTARKSLYSIISPWPVSIPAGVVVTSRRE